jgi:hypothetical protein
VFLLPVGCAGHVVRCILSGARNIDTLFFMLGWDWYRFQKKRAETCYAKLFFLHPVGSAGHLVHCIAFGTQNVNALFFTLGWNRYGFHKKHEGTYYAICIRYGFQKKHDRTRYSELAFLHPVGSTGHVVHCVVFGARNIDALFFYAREVWVRISQKA